MALISGPKQAALPSRFVTSAKTHFGQMLQRYLNRRVSRETRQALELQNCQLNDLMAHRFFLNQGQRAGMPAETREIGQRGLRMCSSLGVRREGLCCETAEKSFCSITCFSILPQILAPHLAELESARYLSFSSLFTTADSLRFFYQPALLEWCLKASCARSGARECMPS